MISTEKSALRVSRQIAAKKMLVEIEAAAEWLQLAAARAREVSQSGGSLRRCDLAAMSAAEIIEGLFVIEGQSSAAVAEFGKIKF